DAAISDEAPLPPGKQDGSELTVSGARSWYLIGNGLTAGDDTFELSVDGPDSVFVVDLWIDGQFVQRARRTSSGWSFAVDIRELAPGSHRALLAADGSRYAFAAVDFKRSHPLYITVSNDWDT